MICPNCGVTIRTDIPFLHCVGWATSVEIIENRLIFRRSPNQIILYLDDAKKLLDFLVPHSKTNPLFTSRIFHCGHCGKDLGSDYYAAKYDKCLSCRGSNLEYLTPSDDATLWYKGARFKMAVRRQHSRMETKKGELIGMVGMCEMECAVEVMLQKSGQNGIPDEREFMDWYKKRGLKSEE